MSSLLLFSFPLQVKLVSSLRDIDKPHTGIWPGRSLHCCELWNRFLRVLGFLKRAIKVVINRRVQPWSLPPYLFCVCVCMRREERERFDNIIVQFCCCLSPFHACLFMQIVKWFCFCFFFYQRRLFRIPLLDTNWNTLSGRLVCILQFIMCPLSIINSNLSSGIKWH